MFRGHRRPSLSQWIVIYTSFIVLAAVTSAVNVTSVAATPSFQPSETVTISANNSTDVQLSPSISPSIDVVGNVTESASPETGTETASVSPKPIGKPSASPTPTISESQSTVESLSATPSETPSVSGSVIPTNDSNNGTGIIVEPSMDVTDTATSSESESSSFSASSTESTSPSASITPTITTSESITPSASPTASETPTSSAAMHQLSPEDIQEQTNEEASLFLAIFCILIILVVGMLCVHSLRVRKLSWFPEAWVYFGIGLFMSMIVAVASSDQLSRIETQLHKSFAEMFFIVLLPPIIFESGYSMDKGVFFVNFWSICMYAFLGTLLSMIVVAVMILLTSVASIIYPFSAVDAFCYGSIISATDPVTVLAVFQELQVDRTLYSLVFGESVLNDAVAIVLYHTLLQFEATAVTVGSVFRGIFFFLENFVGSLAIGVLIGLISALLFKHIRFDRSQSATERGLITIVPFMAYMVSEGLQFSGVVAILFAGISMAHYTVRNLSAGTRRFSMQLFRVLAMVCESLVFVYIGVATPKLFSSVFARHWFFMFWTIAACLAGRWVNVYVCTWILNKYRRDKIQKKPAFMLWFSGLRGGVAFALSSAARDVIPNKEVGAMMETSALFVVVMSMLSIGGSIGPLVRKYDLCEKKDEHGGGEHTDGKSQDGHGGDSHVLPLEDDDGQPIEPSHHEPYTDNEISFELDMENQVAGGDGDSGSGNSGVTTTVKRRSPHLRTPKPSTGVNTPSHPRWDIDPTGIAVPVQESDTNPELQQQQQRRNRRTFWSSLTDLIFSAVTLPPSPAARDGGPLPPRRSSSRRAIRSDIPRGNSLNGGVSLTTSTSPAPMEEKRSLLSSPGGTTTIQDKPIEIADINIGEGVGRVPVPRSNSAVLSSTSSRQPVPKIAINNSFHDPEGGVINVDNDDVIGLSDDDEDDTAPVSWTNMDSKFFTPFFTREAPQRTNSRRNSSVRLSSSAASQSQGNVPGQSNGVADSHGELPGGELSPSSQGSSDHH